MCYLELNPKLLGQFSPAMQTHPSLTSELAVMSTLVTTVCPTGLVTLVLVEVMFGQLEDLLWLQTYPLSNCVRQDPQCVGVQCS